MTPVITRATQICDRFCEKIHETALHEEKSLSTISLVIQERDHCLIKILKTVKGIDLMSKPLPKSSLRKNIKPQLSCCDPLVDSYLLFGVSLPQPSPLESDINIHQTNTFAFIFVTSKQDPANFLISTDTNDIERYARVCTFTSSRSEKLSLKLIYFSVLSLAF